MTIIVSTVFFIIYIVAAKKGRNVSPLFNTPISLAARRVWLELRRLPQILLVLDFWLDVRSINTKLVTFYST